MYSESFWLGFSPRHLVIVCTCCLMATTTTVAVTQERRDPLFTELYSSRKLEKEISFYSLSPRDSKIGPDSPEAGRGRNRSQFQLRIRYTAVYVSHRVRSEFTSSALAGRFGRDFGEIRPKRIDSPEFAQTGTNCPA